jgi:hypothetical protein
VRLDELDCSDGVVVRVCVPERPDQQQLFFRAYVAA